MTELPNIDWERLPDDPIGFFELARDFTRRDLKRAYTRLIKQFKPERFPDEFKRIRSAYETLEDRLRFDQGPQVPFVPQEQTAGGTLPSKTAAPQPDVFDPGALVREHGPEKARDLLKESVGAAAAPWVALALIDDALGSTPAAPFDTLMEASKATSEHPHILGLTGQLLRADMPVAKAVKVLQLMARAAQASRKSGRGPSALTQNYWFLTGPQWLTLARELPFESFEKLMRAVDPLVGEEGFFGRTMLALRLRRILAFRGSDAWLKEIDEDLEEMYQALPDWTEEEFELNQMLAAYRRQRPELLDGSDVRSLIDEAIHDLAELDPEEADRAFVAFNLEVMDRRDEVLSNFDSAAPGAHVIAQVLYAFGTEWRERRGIEAQDMKAFGQLRIREFARRLEKRGDRSLLGSLWNYSVLVLGVLVIGLLVFLGTYSVQRLGPVGWTIPGAIVLALIVGLKQGWAYYPIVGLTRFFGPRVHRRVWRPEAAAFMAETRCPHETLVEGLEALTTDDAHFTAPAIRDDLGLHLYGQALLAIDD